VVVGNEKRTGDGLREPLSLLVAGPKLIRRGKLVDFLFLAGEEVVLDDPRTVGCVGKLEAKDGGVVFGLLEPVSCRLLVRFCLDNSEGDVARVPKEEVGEFLLETSWLAAGNDDAAVRE
jgi:hypothetical protein